MSVPAGEHEVRFHLESKPFNTGGLVSSISSWLLLLVVLGALVISWRKGEAVPA